MKIEPLISDSLEEVVSPPDEILVEPVRATAKARRQYQEAAPAKPVDDGRVTIERYEEVLRTIFHDWRLSDGFCRFMSSAEAIRREYVELNSDGSISSGYLRKLGYDRNAQERINSAFSGYNPNDDGTIEWLILNPKQLADTRKPLLPSFSLDKTIQRFVTDDEVRPFLMKYVSGGEYFAITRRRSGDTIGFEISTQEGMDEQSRAYQILKAGLDYLQITNRPINWGLVTVGYLAALAVTTIVGAVWGGISAELAEEYTWVKVWDSDDMRWEPEKQLTAEGWRTVWSKISTVFPWGAGGSALALGSGIVYKKGKDILEEPLRRIVAVGKAKERAGRRE